MGRALTLSCVSVFYFYSHDHFFVCFSLFCSLIIPLAPFSTRPACSPLPPFHDKGRLEACLLRSSSRWTMTIILPPSTKKRRTKGVGGFGKQKGTYYCFGWKLPALVFKDVVDGAGHIPAGLWLSFVVLSPLYLLNCFPFFSFFF